MGSSDLAEQATELRKLPEMWLEVRRKIMDGKGAAKPDAEDLSYADAMKHCAIELNRAVVSACESMFRADHGDILHCVRLKDHLSPHENGSWEWWDEAAVPTPSLPEAVAGNASAPVGEAVYVHDEMLSLPTQSVEYLAATFHGIYQLEAKRQGDVRHKDSYADLPENIKEFDRALARYVLLHFEEITN